MKVHGRGTKHNVELEETILKNTSVVKVKPKPGLKMRKIAATAHKAGLVATVRLEPAVDETEEKARKSTRLRTQFISRLTKLLRQYQAAGIAPMVIYTELELQAATLRKQNP